MLACIYDFDTAKVAAGHRNLAEEDHDARVEAAREIEALRTGVLCDVFVGGSRRMVELAEAARGEFAGDDRIIELWKRAGL